MTTHSYLTSPTDGPHFPLWELDGDPEDVHAAGTHYTELGQAMSETATELKKLGDDEKYKAKSLDAIREAARELHGDLSKAATRYSETGPVLVTYSWALHSARYTTVNPYVQQIIDAHAASEAAKDAYDDAADQVSDNNRTWFFEDEATDAEKAAAESEKSDAQSTLHAAESDELALWVSFESGCDDWSTAYDDAVRDMASAMELSDLDDSWWEDLLDGIATFVTIVGFVLTVAAIIFGGPILLALAAVAGIIALVAHVIMMSCGSKRVSWTDIALDAVGVLPFAKGFVGGMRGASGMARLSQGLRGGLGLTGASRTVLTTGRTALAGDLRTVTGGDRLINRAAREAAAPGIANGFMDGMAGAGNWGRNALTALRNGGSQYDGAAYNMSRRLTANWPGAGAMGPRVTGFANTYGNLPGVPSQVLNVFNFGYGGYQSAGGDTPPLIDNGIDLAQGEAVRW